MRKIADRLYDFFKPDMSNLIEDQSQYNWHRETNNKLQHTDNNCISECPGESSELKQIPKMFQANPWASHYAQIKPIIFESQCYTIHGYISKNDEIDDNRNEHEG